MFLIQLLYVKHRTKLYFKFFIVDYKIVFTNILLFFRKKLQLVYKFKWRNAEHKLFWKWELYRFVWESKKKLKTPRLTFVLDTCKISDWDTIHNITATIEATLLSIDDFVFSGSWIRRAQLNLRKEGYYNIKSNIFYLYLDLVVIHWYSCCLI